MRESSTYQAILEEGRVEGEIRGARRLVLELGTNKFGPPDATTVTTLERIGDLNILHRLAVGVLQAWTWEELLAAVNG